MKKIFDIFKIKKEERVSALVALIIACALNALTVIKYHSQFSQITENYHKLFVKTFHVAGFDPLTYSIVSHWDTEYNVYRHPLLAYRHQLRSVCRGSYPGVLRLLFLHFPLPYIQRSDWYRAL